MTEPDPQPLGTTLSGVERDRLLGQVYDEFRLLTRRIMVVDRARQHLAPTTAPSLHPAIDRPATRRSRDSASATDRTTPIFRRHGFILAKIPPPEASALLTAAPPIAA